MKEQFLQLARYNIWASGRLLKVLQTLPEDVLSRPLTSSFASLRETVQHLYSAEDVWLQRLQLVEHPVWRGEFPFESFAVLAEAWQDSAAGLLAFVQKQYDDRGFSHVVQYRNRQKELHKTPVSDILLHVFNHATYHRGQLVALLRQAGVAKIPGTDYIAWLQAGRK